MGTSVLSGVKQNDIADGMRKDEKKRKDLKLNSVCTLIQNLHYIPYLHSFLHVPGDKHIIDKSNQNSWGFYIL